jgi:multidrug efflux pump subunit AcrA (membrane-fusion protein)
LAGAIASRDEAALRLDRMIVRSPAAGVVMTRHVNIGSKVMLAMDGELSATIVRLFDPTRLQVRVDVPLADAAKIGVGMPARVIVSSLPDQTFAGEVTRLVNEADVTRNTLQVKVGINDPDPRLKPEMLARVRFFEPIDPTGDAPVTNDRAVFAPAKLVEEGRAWIAVDGIARLRDVTLGEAREGDWIEVASGLMPGDRLIADPADLQDGDRVDIVGETEGGDDGFR